MYLSFVSLWFQSICFFVYIYTCRLVIYVFSPYDFNHHVCCLWFFISYLCYSPYIYIYSNYVCSTYVQLLHCTNNDRLSHVRYTCIDYIQCIFSFAALTKDVVSCINWTCSYVLLHCNDLLGYVRKDIILSRKDWHSQNQFTHDTANGPDIDWNKASWVTHNRGHHAEPGSREYVNHCWVVGTAMNFVLETVMHCCCLCCTF